MGNLTALEARNISDNFTPGDKPAVQDVLKQIEVVARQSGRTSLLLKTGHGLSSEDFAYLHDTLHFMITSRGMRLSSGYASYSLFEYTISW